MCGQRPECVFHKSFQFCGLCARKLNTREVFILGLEQACEQIDWGFCYYRFFRLVQEFEVIRSLYFNALKYCDIELLASRTVSCQFNIYIYIYLNNKGIPLERIHKRSLHYMQKSTVDLLTMSAE